MWSTVRETLLLAGAEHRLDNHDGDTTELERTILFDVWCRINRETSAIALGWRSHSIIAHRMQRLAPQ
ncbi:MAG: hypothetical protein HEQ35_30980 [Gloeotrichia echinulata IR180]|jgi:hypothetical protein|nr:hypothetical protein [Gloeotrichia echinulata DEX184]